MQINLWHDKEIATLQKETISHQSMEMRVPKGIVSECLYCNYDPWYPKFLAKSKLEELRQLFEAHWLSLPAVCGHTERTFSISSEWKRRIADEERDTEQSS